MVSTIMKRCAAFAALALLVMTAVAYASDITTEADLANVQKTAQGLVPSGQRILGDYTPQVQQRSGKYYFAPSTLGNRLKAFYIGDLSSSQSVLTQYGVNPLRSASPRTVRVAGEPSSPSAVQGSLLNLPLDTVQKRQEVAKGVFNAGEPTLSSSPAAQRIIGTYGNENVARRGRYYFTRFAKLRSAGTVYIGPAEEAQRMSSTTGASA